MACTDVRGKDGWKASCGIRETCTLLGFPVLFSGLATVLSSCTE